MIDHVGDIELLLEKAVVAEISRIDYQSQFQTECTVQGFLEYLKFLTMGQGLNYLKTTIGVKETFKGLGENLWVLEALENIAQAFYYHYYLYMEEAVSTEEIKRRISTVVFGLGTSRDGFDGLSKISEEFEPLYHKLHDKTSLEALFETLPWMSVIYLLAVFQTVQKIEQAAETTRSVTP